MPGRDDWMNLLKRSLWFLSDERYVRLYYRLKMGKKLNLENPRTFNEKLQWLKFNYRFPLQTLVTDKILVRDYVREKIGEKYLIPLVGCWDRFDEIDFDAFPNQFVLKCNHDSGGLVICRDKAKFDPKDAKKIVERSLNTNFYYNGREYQYKNIVPRILCEQFISEDGSIPMDYKVHCFHGKAEAVLVCFNRFRNQSHKAEYQLYDREWNYLPQDGEKKDHPLKAMIPKPKNLDEMLAISEILSKDFLFARIDLYCIHDRIYFGEITLSPSAGFDDWFSASTDLLLGEKLKISYEEQWKKE